MMVAFRQRQSFTSLHFTRLGIKSDLGERCAPWVGKYTRVGAGRVKCCVIISLPARQWKVN